MDSEDSRPRFRTVRAVDSAAADGPFGGGTGTVTCMATNPPPRVFLADGSSMIRSRLAALLDAHQMKMVGAAATPPSCTDGILAAHPDVVVLVKLEGGTGLQVLRAVRQAAPDIAFLVFTNNAGPAYRKSCLDQGAAFLLDKSSDLIQLPAAIIDAGMGRPPRPLIQ